ncbi:MAG: hypothetical protein ABIO71_14330 [Caldimonas sp.]
MAVIPPVPDTPEVAKRLDAEVDAIVSAGPAGTFAVAGVATAVVVAIYFAFYFLVYLPRGAVQ